VCTGGVVCSRRRGACHVPLTSRGGASRAGCARKGGVTPSKPGPTRDGTAHQSRVGPRPTRGLVERPSEELPTTLESLPRKGAMADSCAYRIQAQGNP
jgi:hypothetical protein